MTDEELLTREDALILVDDFLSTVPDLEGQKLEDEAKEHVHRLVEGLHRLPLPPDVRGDRVKEIRGWTEVLLEREGGGEEEAGQGSDATLLRKRLRELRRKLEGDAEE